MAKKMGKYRMGRKERAGKKGGFAVLFLFLGMAVWLPGQILAWQSSQDIERVKEVPKENYAAERSAMAREVSSKLSVEEKLQLIDGTWESETMEADDYEMELQEYEAVGMARQKVGELYQKGEFPVDLAGEYQNWYGWQTQPYKAVDSIFHTYTAYFWEITFERYDKSESYTVRMLEDGTVFDLAGYPPKISDRRLSR